ncbi:MAG TPA: malto-oligosyltrehalose synthase [Vicinamibacterales bacterium]|nr:malto-oligosyltrehalose synthase [Vicinamibacterales bacterium]
MPPTRTPLSTYRLQFNRCFTFRDARSVVDYLHDLGVSDCYASSYLKAVPGSLHGYDVADPTRLNPEIGSAEDHAAWIDAMQARGMGHVLDLVPNHMGIAKSSNPWWLDVLENGACSRFARFFDFEWRPVKDELANKVLIPILGDQYGEVLERQELKLTCRDGAFFVVYYDDTLPVAPDTFGMVFDGDLDAWQSGNGGSDADELLSILTASRNLPARSERSAEAIAVRAREKEIVKRRLANLAERSADVRGLIDRSIARLNGVAGQPHSFDALDRLLNVQSYRLAHWRVASEEINYRRFFDVNQLAALRVEDPAVFDEVHRFVFELVDSGAVTGLRIDHVDGLFDPRDYLRRLQERAPGRGFFVVVEKILAPGEQLATDWPVSGTTGYDFANAVNGLFVDTRNERAFDDIYRRFARERIPFDDLSYRAKKQVLHETMSGDINSLGHQLNRFSERNRHFRDFTLYSLISTLKEVIACFPVYRTYLTAGDPISDPDRRYITQAIRCAKRRAPGVTGVVFDFIQKLLLKQTPATPAEQGEERARFIGKFQQLTGPVAAKGIEDTALYLHNRLISLNEVGSDPTQFGVDSATVHAWMADRQARWPHALSATSTHDTKRGEDVRARVNVLSELPGAWKDAARRWRALNRRCKQDVKGVTAPDSNEEYFLYQTLIGAWPFEQDDETRRQFVERIIAYATKALREAKAHTSWLSPDEEYERAVHEFLRAILERRRTNLFLRTFEPFQARIAQLAIYNSLSQLAIKITAPGVPDFYQGTEFWDLTLVDPDNRRQVDYATRRLRLSAMEPCSGRAAAPETIRDLLAHSSDGRVKMYVMNRALAARARLRDVYEAGAYTALAAAGARRDCVFAFARGDRAITCVPRLVATLTGDGTPPLGPEAWGDTRIDLPAPLRGRMYCDVFTGARLDAGDTLALASVFERFPVALLVPADDALPDRP